MSDEFEKALHRALRPRNPGEGFSARVLAQLESAASTESSGPSDSSELSPIRVPRLEQIRHRMFRSRWLPAAFAACLIAAIGLVQMRQHALDAARANQARAQLLQALSIASANVNIVRATVAREEHPDS